MPCFPVKYSRSTMLWSTLLWYFDFVLWRCFVQSLEILRREITKIFDWRVNILNQSQRSIRWRTDQLKKAPLSVQAVFQVAPAPISSWFLCPRPPLLFSAPNQNCHAAQAKNMLKENTVRGRWWQLILDLQCNISVTDIASFVCMITMFTKVLFVQSWKNVTTTFWGYNTLVVLFSIRAVSSAKFVRSLWRCLFLNII